MVSIYLRMTSKKRFNFGDFELMTLINQAMNKAHPKKSRSRRGNDAGVFESFSMKSVNMVSFPKKISWPQGRRRHEASGIHRYIAPDARSRIH